MFENKQAAFKRYALHSLYVVTSVVAYRFVEI